MLHLTLVYRSESLEVIVGSSTEIFLHFGGTKQKCVNQRMPAVPRIRHENLYCWVDREKAERSLHEDTLNPNRLHNMGCAQTTMPVASHSPAFVCENQSTSH